MSRQLDQVTEEREAHRRLALIKALEFDLAGSIEGQGLDFVGFAVYYDSWDCLIILKAKRGAKRVIAKVGSDTVVGCILKAVSKAQNDRLRWRTDKYPKPKV